MTDQYGNLSKVDAVSMAMDAKREHAAAVSEITRLEGAIQTLAAGIGAVDHLINESDGVYGLAGDMPAAWSELLPGGEASDWLADYSEALQLLQQMSEERRRQAAPASTQGKAA